MDASRPVSAPRVSRWFGAAALLVLLAAMLALFAWGLARRAPSEGPFGVNVSGRQGQVTVRALPASVLRTYDGGELRLSDLAGKPLVVNFWGSWCVPCRQEAPVLERVWQTTRDRGVTFLGVSVWDAERDSVRFIEELNITYLNAADTGGQLAIELGLTGIPETYFVDASGRIVDRWIGPVREEQLMAMVERLITPRGPAAASGL